MRCASSNPSPSVAGPADTAIAAETSPRAMPKTPVMALSTDRLKAVGETGWPSSMSARMPAVRRSSPWREANTMRAFGTSDTQSCATLSALFESELRRRRTIGSIKPMSGDDAESEPMAGQQDQRATGIVQCKSGISVFACGAPPWPHAARRPARGGRIAHARDVCLDPIRSRCCRLIWVSARAVMPAGICLSERLLFPNPGPNHTEKSLRKTTTCGISYDRSDECGKRPGAVKTRRRITAPFNRAPLLPNDSAPRDWGDMKRSF